MQFELTKYHNGRWACIRPDLRYSERDRWPAIRDQYAAHFAAYGLKPDEDALGFSIADTDFSRESHEKAEEAYASLPASQRLN